MKLIRYRVITISGKVIEVWAFDEQDAVRTAESTSGEKIKSVKVL